MWYDNAGTTHQSYWRAQGRGTSRAAPVRRSDLGGAGGGMAASSSDDLQLSLITNNDNLATLSRQNKKDGVVFLGTTAWR